MTTDGEGRELLDKVIQAVIDEPELPGPMPRDMYSAFKTADEDTMAGMLRIIVRETKKGILERITALEKD